MNERRRAPRADAWADFRTRWRTIVRDFVCIVDCDDEESGDPSLMKVMSVVFAIAAVHNPFVHDKPLTAMDLGMGFLAACTYCGYRGLKIFGKSRAVQVEGQTSAVTVDVTRAIEERRTAGGGAYEKTP